MPELLDLPDEIIFMLCDVTSPPEFDAFYRTCRRIYDVARCKRLPLHVRLKRLYRNYRIGSYLEGHNHPAHLLYDIWVDPFLSYYIKSMSFVNNDAQPENLEDATHDALSIVEKMRQCVPDLLVRSPVFSRSNDIINQAELYRAAGVPTFALLLSFLPTLKNLNIQYDPENIHPVIQTLLEIHHLNQISRSGSPYSPLPYSHLTIDATLAQRLGSYDIQGLAIWTPVPFLRSLSGKRIRSGQMCSDEPSLQVCTECSQPHDSQIERVILQGWLMTQCLRKFLSPFKYLRCLDIQQMNWACGPRNLRGCCSPNHMIAAISETVGDTLEILRLIGPPHRFPRRPLPWDMQRPLPPLTFRDLKQLKELVLGPAVILPFFRNQDDGAWADMQDPLFVDILPTSLVTFTLHLMHVDLEDIRSLFRDWSERKVQNLPHLRVLQYHDTHNNHEVAEYLRSLGINAAYSST